MFKDFSCLWRSREKPDTLQRWLKVWLKRLFHFYGVFNLLVRPTLFRVRGAAIGPLTILGKSRIVGSLTNLCIGYETSLGRCEIWLHAQVRIGNRVVINDGVIFLTASHSIIDPKWAHKRSPITVGDYAWVATNAIILPGVTIGRGSVVGAGAVVRCDVPDYAVVIGNPAMVQPQQRTQELSYSPVMLNAPFEAWVGSDFYGKRQAKTT